MGDGEGDWRDLRRLRAELPLGVAEGEAEESAPKLPDDEATDSEGDGSGDGFETCLGGFVRVGCSTAG